MVLYFSKMCSSLTCVSANALWGDSLIYDKLPRSYHAAGLLKLKPSLIMYACYECGQLWPRLVIVQIMEWANSRYGNFWGGHS